MAIAYEFGRVQVRPAERQVLVDGKHAAIAGRAYDLLLALIDHRNRVVTKEELLDMVWAGLVVEEHNLHTQVSVLRKIIGRGSVSTIAGRGYRFVAPITLISASKISYKPALLAGGVALRKPEGGTDDSEFPRASIAVLPFTNMSGDSSQDYFSDGVTEDIITDLSKSSALTVVARNSSFAYRLSGASFQAVGRELGVSSILRGAVRRVGNRVRITAQLVDTASGAHLWAERYDCGVTDIFAIQDEVTRRIVAELTSALRADIPSRLAGRSTRSAEAHDRFLFGRELLRDTRSLNLELFDQIVAAFMLAIDLDPGYAAPYACLSVAHCFDYQNGLTANPGALDLAARYAEQAVDKGPDEPEARFASASVAFWKRDLAMCRMESERALALNPNYALAYGARGNVESYLGTPLQGLPYIRCAISLDPFFTYQNLHFLGAAHLLAAQYEAAAAALRERVRLAPNTDMSRAYLAAALGHLGEFVEARRIWNELKVVNPKYSLSSHLARLPFKVTADRERIRKGIRMAGLGD